jgi:hypothetical protein
MNQLPSSRSTMVNCFTLFFSHQVQLLDLKQKSSMPYVIKGDLLTFLQSSAKFVIVRIYCIH